MKNRNWQQANSKGFFTRIVAIPFVVRVAVRILWNMVGFASLSAGAAGIVLPLLPATPFFILSAYAFSRGSPKIESWLLGHPRWGPVILDWRRERAVSRRAKVASLSAICATPLLTWMIGAGPAVLAMQAAVLVAVAIFIATRPGPTNGHG